MRKQVDYVYRQIQVSAINPEISYVEASRFVREEYLQNGWEVMRSEVVNFEANTVFIGLHFVKYEVVPDEVRESSGAKRGRPRKIGNVEVVDAVS